MEAALKAYQQVTQKEFRDRLVVEHLEYVRHVLGRMLGSLPPFVDAENLESAGVLGLVEAASQFDPNRGVAFRTFAHHRIRGAILDELRRNCPLPQALLQQWASLRRTLEQLGAQATSAALAAACGMREDEVEECLAAIRLTQPESWHDELGKSSWQHSESEAQQLNEAEQRQVLADAIEELPERLRLVLSLHYLEDLRLAEIGEVLGVSESRVSRLLARAELELKGILSRRNHSAESNRSESQASAPGRTPPLRGPHANFQSRKQP